MPGWGGGVAAACFTVLSVWRWQDGQTGWALVLLLFAFLQLAMIARRTASRWGRSQTPDRVGPSPTEIEHARRHKPGWRAIGLVAVLGALAVVALYPPLALVLAGLGVYALSRARGYGRLLAGAS